jgi:diguanylate cyclase (GGDEF)-like protein
VRPSFKTYFAFVFVAIGTYFFSPDDTWLQTAWFVLIGLCSGGAILAGVRLHRPAGAAAFRWFAAGISLNALGTLVEAVMGKALHVETFPSVADVFYLALYPALVVGLLLLIRRRTSTREWGPLLDATTITTGLGLLSWVFVIHPAAGDRTLGLLGHVVSVAYPVCDVVLLAMMMRLLFGAGSRSPAFRLMAGSLLLFLGGDAAWAVVNQLGWTPGVHATHVLQMNFLVAYALFGAAALHPSVRELGEPAALHRPRLSPLQLGLLSCASLIAPAILAGEVARDRVTDGVAIVVGSVAMFLLVVTRMAQLLRRVEEQARQLRELAWIDELTGLPNRRAWSAELPHAIERARREDVPLTIAMIDLDYFKRFNDELGHQAGDRLLKGASAAWREELREVDQLARYGGDEFLLLLPGADGVEASEVLERLRGATTAGQTFSAGLATWDAVETSEELLARADTALYDAKNLGRDRAVVAAM